MEDKSPSVFQKFVEEMRAGNPLILLLVLALVVVLSGAWVWQTIRNPVVNTPTPRFRHPTVISPLKVLTARALTSIPPQASMTPAAAVLMPTPLPQVVFFFNDEINQDD